MIITWLILCFSVHIIIHLIVHLWLLTIVSWLVQSLLWNQHVQFRCEILTTWKDSFCSLCETLSDFYFGQTSKIKFITEDIPGSAGSFCHFHCHLFCCTLLGPLLISFITFQKYFPHIILKLRSFLNLNVAASKLQSYVLPQRAHSEALANQFFSQSILHVLIDYNHNIDFNINKIFQCSILAL
jgi:hypothetical protein